MSERTRLDEIAEQAGEMFRRESSMTVYDAAAFAAAAGFRHGVERGYAKAPPACNMLISLVRKDDIQPAPAEEKKCCGFTNWPHYHPLHGSCGPGHTLAYARHDRRKGERRKSNCTRECCTRGGYGRDGSYDRRGAGRDPRG